MIVKVGAHRQIGRGTCTQPCPGLDAVPLWTGPVTQNRAAGRQGHVLLSITGGVLAEMRGG